MFYQEPPRFSGEFQRRLIDEENYTPRQIAKAVGVCVKTVNDLLLLLRLEPETQQLIATEKLPRDARMAGALLSLHAEARVKLARQMAGGKSIQAVLKATEKLKQELNLSAASRGKLPREAPALCLTRTRKANLKAADPPDLGRDGRLPPDIRSVAWTYIRQQAQETCQACEVKAEALAYHFDHREKIEPEVRADEAFLAEMKRRFPAHWLRADHERARQRDNLESGQAAR